MLYKTPHLNSIAQYCPVYQYSNRFKFQNKQFFNDLWFHLDILRSNRILIFETLSQWFFHSKFVISLKNLIKQKILKWQTLNRKIFVAKVWKSKIWIDSFVAFSFCYVMVYFIFSGGDIFMEKFAIHNCLF